MGKPWSLALALFPLISVAQIQVVSATYGGNCGASADNAKTALAAACDGQFSCAYAVDFQVLGDPAPGCKKDFTAKYLCSTTGTARQQELAPEAGRGSVLNLSCGVLQRGAEAARAKASARAAAYAKQVLASTDFNGDGHPDIAWHNLRTGDNSIWLMNGSTPTFVALRKVDDLDWQMGGTGDFNGDGKADIVWRNYRTGENSIWLMNGTTPQAFLTLQRVDDLNWQIVGTGDFNGDSKIDLIWRNARTGDDSIWLMNGITPANFLVVKKVDDLNWQLAGSGDFNADGMPDLLWRDYATGENSIWLMNGTDPTEFLTIQKVDDRDWQMMGSLDFNGDGVPDILWRNDRTGENSLWPMDGIAPKNFLVIQKVEDLDWEMAGPPSRNYSKLAGFWAPVLSQDVDSANVRADYLTNFDYDGDWLGANNWSHLNQFDLKPMIYYWVVEGRDRYFIGYAFFHPRDWTSTDQIDDPAHNPFEHVNDLEGALLSVKKDPTARFGRFEGMVTVAHSDFFSFADDDTPTAAPAFNAVSLSQRITHEDEDLDFVVDDVGVHPVVYLQAEGHAAYGHPLKGKAAEHYLDDWAPLFVDNHVTDWRHANWDGTPEPPLSGAVTQTANRSGWGDGVIYHFESIPDNGVAPVGVTALPHDWQVIGYALRSIGDLWSRRADAGTFDSFGNFSPGGAQAPWGWHSGNFFLNPAQTMLDSFGGWTGAAPVSCAYINNSFGAPPGGCPAKN